MIRGKCSGRQKRSTIAARKKAKAAMTATLALPIGTGAGRTRRRHTAAKKRRRHATLAWTSLACPSGQQNRKGIVAARRMWPATIALEMLDCSWVTSGSGAARTKDAALLS